LTESLQVRINETYSNYKPPVNVARVVRKLLAQVPDRYARGLDCIVLSNLSSQPRRRRLGKTTSRGRRLPQSRISGLYHPKWKGRPPSIELYVDQILGRWPKWTLWMPPFCDLAIADVFYHELGHHVHLFVRPEYREKEDVADDWRDKFMRVFFRKKYWYLIPLFRLRTVIRGNRTTRSRIN
jgi:hypothetical protein